MGNLFNFLKYLLLKHISRVFCKQEKQQMLLWQALKAKW